MERTIILIYKTRHTDTKKEIAYFNSFEDAKKEASRMIEQFKYWGGGSVPVVALESIHTKARGYRDAKRVEYNEGLYIQYARENGNNYGYYKDMHKKELKKIA